MFLQPVEVKNMMFLLAEVLSFLKIFL